MGKRRSGPSEMYHGNSGRLRHVGSMPMPVFAWLEKRIRMMQSLAVNACTIPFTHYELLSTITTDADRAAMQFVETWSEPSIYARMPPARSLCLPLDDREVSIALAGLSNTSITPRKDYAQAVLNARHGDPVARAKLDDSIKFQVEVATPYVDMLHAHAHLVETATPEQIVFYAPWVRAIMRDGGILDTQKESKVPTEFEMYPADDRDIITRYVTRILRGKPPDDYLMVSREDREAFNVGTRALAQFGLLVPSGEDALPSITTYVAEENCYMIGSRFGGSRMLGLR